MGVSSLSSCCAGSRPTPPPAEDENAIKRKDISILEKSIDLDSMHNGKNGRPSINRSFITESSFRQDDNMIIDDLSDYVENTPEEQKF
mgnify:CR=1 FL=1